MFTGYRDRSEAGTILARQLSSYAGRTDVVVLALPRGGVPVAYEVARSLDAPLDVFLVRKLGVPGQEEFAMGAIAGGGVRLLSREVVEALAIEEHEIAAVVEKEERELARRERLYRGSGARVEVAGRTVLLVDDGLATGSSMRVGIAALRAQHPARIVVAVPVAARSTCDELAGEVDDMVCAATPEPLHAVGLWYRDFSQTSDEEVIELLGRAAHERDAHPTRRRKRAS